MRRLSVVLSVLLWVTPLALATARAQVFTPRQAVAFALTHNSEAALARDQEATARSQLQMAQDQGGPTAAVSYGYLFSNNPLEALSAELERRQVTAQAFAPSALNHPGVTHLGTTTLSLSWPLYQGGVRRDGIKAGRYGQKAARRMAQRSRQTIVAHVVRAYEGVLAAQAAQAVAQKGVNAAARHARTARYLYARGRIVHADALTAAVNLGSNEGVLAEAQGDVAIARASLALAMGAPPSLSITTLKVTKIAIPWPHHTLSHYLAIALRHRVDIKALHAEVLAAEAQARSARAQSSFQVRVMAQSQWFSATPGLRHNAWTVGAVISKTLYDGHHNQDRASVLGDHVRELNADLAGLRSRIQYQVTEAYQKMQNAAQSYHIAQANVVRAKNAVALIRVRYGEGRTILLDLLNAEAALVRSRESRLTALYTLVSERIALAQDCGTLSQKTLGSLGLPS